MAQVGVEPTASRLLRAGGLPVAYRAVCRANTRRGSRTHRRPGLGRAARPIGVAGRRVQFRGQESNLRPPGSEPGVATSSNCPGVTSASRDGWTRTNVLLLPKQAGTPATPHLDAASQPLTRRPCGCDRRVAFFSRDGRIRTSGFPHPKRADCQAFPHPERQSA